MKLFRATLGLPVRPDRTLKWYFSCVDEARRRRGVVLESLDEERDAKSLARQAWRSRTQFYRLFRAMIEETPVAMRRRLLLERAAWQLSRTQLPVTEIGLNANYGSLEAFTRRSEKRFASPPACIAEWARHTLNCTPRAEFIIIAAKAIAAKAIAAKAIAAKAARKELINQWTFSIFSPARSPGTPGVCSSGRLQMNSLTDLSKTR